MNKFDRIDYDLTALYAAAAKNRRTPPPRSAPGSLAALLWRRLLVRSGWHKRLLLSNLSTGWFDDFERFWRERLGGRPIDVVDFQFLRLHYRVRFQQIGHTDETDERAYLAAWQDRTNVYLLFASVWLNAKEAYLSFLPILRFLPKQGRLLEYGAGIAPITTGLLRYYGHRNYRFTIADILQLNFVYAVDRLGNAAEHILLTPLDNRIDASETYDAIFCLAVLEHVPNPDEVVRSFHAALKPGGRLIFNYIKGDGNGLDSKGSVARRERAIDWLHGNFDLLHGTLDKERSLGLTIVGKR